MAQSTVGRSGTVQKNGTGTKLMLSLIHRDLKETLCDVCLRDPRVDHSFFFLT